MPGKSSKSRAKSVRFPLDLLADVECEARRRSVTANELIVEAVRAYVPEAPRELPKGQASLDELVADFG
jgi:hypothetical protein